MPRFAVRFLPEAQSEFEQAIEWYAEREKGLALDFIEKIRSTLQRISQFPHMHRATYRDVRKAAVKRFPYVIVYRIEENELLIVAVMHTARSDRQWVQRLSQ